MNRSDDIILWKRYATMERWKPDDSRLAALFTTAMEQMGRMNSLWRLGRDRGVRFGVGRAREPI